MLKHHKVASIMGKHAIIFGASGIQGWAVVNALLSDPSNECYTRITALTSRPLPPEQRKWPIDSRLRTVHGVDLLGGSAENLTEMLAENIPDVNTVSHVYYAGTVGIPQRRVGMRSAYEGQ